MGYAFSQAVRANPRLDLWQADGIHPNRAGSYLAAAVIYDSLVGRYLKDSTSDGGLGPGSGGRLRRMARRVVLTTEAGGAGRVRLPMIRDDPWSGSDGQA